MFKSNSSLGPPEQTSYGSGPQRDTNMVACVAGVNGEGEGEQERGRGGTGG